MGQREEMLLALGIDPTAGITPPPPPPGLVDIIKDGVRSNADAFRKAVVGSTLGPSDPERDLLYSQGNPIAVAAARAGGQYAAGKMDDGIAKRGLEYVSGSPAPPEKAAGGVGTSLGMRGLEGMASPELKPQYVPDVNIQPAPVLGAAGSRPAGIAGGVGGGFGGLEKNLRDAQGRQLGSIDAAANLETQLGQDKAGRVLLESDMREADAQRRMRDAEQAMRIEADAQQRHQAFLAKQEQLADDIAKQGIDPGRLLRNQDLGTQVTFGLGSALGEMFSSTGRNSYLDRVQTQIDQDVKAQTEGNEAKREGYKARSSLFDKMLAESGDRRLAGMQTQKMLYDAIDRKLVADAARLGVPELMTNAEIKAQEFRQKSADLSVQIATQALNLARQQAAAAAAQQAAAAERLRQHTIDMIKLQQEQEKIDISRESKVDLQKQIQALGEKLSDKDLAEGRGAVDAAKRRLMSLKPDEGLPGVGPMADARAGLHPKSFGDMVLGGVPGLIADKALGLSDAERVSRGDWEKIKLAYQKQITGSGASEGERRMLTQAFEGARSPAEQRNAIMQADDYFTRRESAIKAGFDPRAVATFEQRQSAINPQLPASAKESR